MKNRWYSRDVLKSPTLEIILPLLSEDERSIIEYIDGKITTWPGQVLWTAGTTEASDNIKSISYSLSSA